MSSRSTSPASQTRASGNLREKGLNLAKSKSYSDSLEEQARDLITAMESDPAIDMNKYWKVRERERMLLVRSQVLLSSWC